MDGIKLMIYEPVFQHIIFNREGGLILCWTANTSFSNMFWIRVVWFNLKRPFIHVLEYVQEESTENFWQVEDTD